MHFSRGIGVIVKKITQIAIKKNQSVFSTLKINLFCKPQFTAFYSDFLSF
jgi:hypothetical protein